MLQVEYLLVRPVEVVGQVGQLLVESLVGVDRYTATGSISSPGSTSN